MVQYMMYSDVLGPRGFMISLLVTCVSDSIFHNDYYFEVMIEDAHMGTSCLCQSKQNNPRTSQNHPSHGGTAE